MSSSRTRVPDIDKIEAALNDALGPVPSFYDFLLHDLERCQADIGNLSEEVSHLEKVVSASLRSKLD
jgi:hypothetical protein